MLPQPMSATVRRALAVAGAVAATLVLILSVTAFAGSAAVTIRETDERYHFVPAEITIGVGQTVTWTNGSDASHTVTSDSSGGPMDSDLIDEDGTYQATFNSEGDFAYHCEVHDYMHGTVHVEGQPPTDAASDSTGAGSTQVIVGLGGAGALLAFAGFQLRLRRRRA